MSTEWKSSTHVPYLCIFHVPHNANTRRHAACLKMFTNLNQFNLDGRVVVEGSVPLSAAWRDQRRELLLYIAPSAQVNVTKLWTSFNLIEILMNTVTCDLFILSKRWTPNLDIDIKNGDLSSYFVRQALRDNAMMHAKNSSLTIFLANWAKVS